MTVAQPSHALPLVGRTPPKPVPPCATLADSIGRSLLTAGLSRKSACDLMGIDEGQWSRSLSTGNVPLARLLLLGDLFWSSFGPELHALAGRPAKGKAAIVREALMAVSQLVVALTCEDDDARRSA